MKTLREFALSINPSITSISIQALAAGSSPPISLRDLLDRKTVYQLTIEKLTCHAQEDLTFDDSCRLDIFTDGSLEFPLKRDLDTNETWTINASYLFVNQVVIKLWDEDDLDSDDWLGTATIPAIPQSNATAKFSEDGAKYTLIYSVTPHPVPHHFDIVQEEIRAFEQSSTASAWKNLSKAELIANIKTNINEPLFVNQGSTPLCGPAAIAFTLVQKQPKHYVQICRQLWETGKFQARTKVIKPSEDLRNSTNDPKNSISTADWMFMATLRDVANAVFDVKSGSTEFVMGISTPWEMEGWAEELLGYDTTDFTSTFLFGENSAMRNAQKALDKGGVGFLMIDSSLIQKEAALVNYPKHWIVFLGGLNITDDTIGFDYYSWGSRKSLLKDEGAFEDGFFGVVTAT